MHNNSKEITGPFMKEYHFLVSTTVGKFNGFIHKTTGDGHLISFGLMDQTENLSDILSIKNEVQDAENNKGKILTEMAIKVFEDLVEQYENLKIKYDVCDELNIGGALAAGHIETQIQGDETFRREVDIGGDTILRSARLEAYTKPLMEKIGIQCSMLILSPELIDNLKTNIDFDYWQVVDKDIAVRDFPAIKKVYYRIWKYKLGRPVRIAS
jgi:class 3 adenylate cyclase